MPPAPTNRLVRLLTQRGPSLTSTLAAQLRAEGLSAEAARQAVSRKPEGVRVLYGLPFPKRAKFLFLEDQFGTDGFLLALTAAVKEASPAYASALTALRARNGVMPMSHFEIASGAPVKQKGHLSAKAILERLTAVKLISLMQVEGLGECVVLAGDEPNISQLRARLLTENVLLDGIRRWAVGLNFASQKKTRLRNESPAPQFSTFCFDLCGPCYLRPLHRWRNGKLDAGFIVADVLLGGTLGTEEVEPFIRKCSTLGHLRGIRPFLPMLIADGFTPEALKTCRSEGIVATHLETIFGEDVGRALGDLLQTLLNAAAIAASKPDRIEKLFNSLSKIEGAAGNLRGALFEVVVGHMVRAIETGSIDIGEIVIDAETGNRAEMDVRLVREKNVTVYECKGYQPFTAVQAKEVEDWLTKKVPIIVSAHRRLQRFANGRMRFEFWTSGVFDEDALKLLVEAKERTNKYAIDWKDGAAISEYSQQLAAPGIRKILSEHYFSHPTAKLGGPAT